MDFPVVLRMPVHWGDMDALGHVNNARYFTWFESARVAAFRRVGLLADPAGIGPVLASTACEFRKPIVWPAEVEVGARIGRVGNSSMTMEYAVWPAGQPSDVHATGTATVVVVRFSTMEKVRVPDDVRERIAALHPAPHPAGDGGEP